LARSIRPDLFAKGTCAETAAITTKIEGIAAFLLIAESLALPDRQRGGGSSMAAHVRTIFVAVICINGSVPAIDCQGNGNILPLSVLLLVWWWQRWDVRHLDSCQQFGEDLRHIRGRDRTEVEGID
jgi:hypothetical protein